MLKVGMTLIKVGQRDKGGGDEIFHNFILITRTIQKSWDKRNEMRGKQGKKRHHLTKLPRYEKSRKNKDLSNYVSPEWNSEGRLGNRTEKGKAGRLSRKKNDNF